MVRFLGLAGRGALCDWDPGVERVVQMEGSRRSEWIIDAGAGIERNAWDGRLVVYETLADI